jgi:hypothetical protein
MTRQNLAFAKLLIGPETKEAVQTCELKQRLRHIDHLDQMQLLHLMWRTALMNSHWWIETSKYVNYAHSKTENCN